MYAIKADNLIGRKYGMLTVIARAENSVSGKTRWICQCDCGKVKDKPVAGYELKAGKVRSCGCLYFESNKEIAQKFATHRMTDTRIWTIWQSMKQRCKYNKNYQNISVCEEWQDFLTFYKWAVCNGYSDFLTLDRIDNNGNYEPGNCRWVTYKVQENNRRNNVFVEYNGERHTLSEWGDITGIRSATIAWRLHNGWPTEELFIEPDLRNAAKRRKRA